MAKTEKPTDEGRRNFLKFAAVAAPAAAAAGVAGQADAHHEEEPEGRGLRKTAHVKAYLASARF